MSAVIVHPETGQHAVVPPEAVHQYRQSGWLLASEHAANQADAADAARRAEGDAKAAKHPTTTKGEEK